MTDLIYPIRITSGTLSTTDVPLSGHLRQFVETMIPERVLIPEYGLPDLIFERGISAPAMSAIILANITRWFPDVDVRVSTIMNPTGRYNVRVQASDLDLSILI